MKKTDDDLLGRVYTTEKKYKNAAGEIRFYQYLWAWRGGPRIKSKPGTADFLKELIHHDQNRFSKEANTLAGLLDHFEAHGMEDKAKDTVRGYMIDMKKIKAERFAQMPLEDVEHRLSRKHFAAWHKSMKGTPRAANRALTTLRRALNFAVNEGLIDRHHAGKIELFDEKTRADIIWSDADIARIDLLPAHIAVACRLALWTGQRQADLLHLTWAHIHHDHIMLDQRKTKTRVFIWLSESLRAILDTLPQHDHGYVLTTLAGRPWGSGFAASLRPAFKKAGIAGVTFHDLRGTFENRCWQSGCTEAEAYSITGRALNEQSAMAYYNRSIPLSRAAMEKVEKTFGEQNCTKI